MNALLHGLGRVGKAGMGRGDFDWRTEQDLKRVADFSPQVALARYYKIPFDPSLQTIVGTFTSPVQTLAPISLGVNPGSNRLGIVTVIDQIVLQVDAPNYNVGMANKGLLDFFWARQTGIESTLLVDGSPRYAVAVDPVPIANLLDMFTEMWPYGWVLNSSHIPKMQMSTSFPLPSVPVTVTASFRMWQPRTIQRLTQLTDAMALAQLCKCGVMTDDEIAGWCEPG